MLWSYSLHEVKSHRKHSEEKHGDPFIPQSQPAEITSHSVVPPQTNPRARGHRVAELAT